MIKISILFFDYKFGRSIMDNINDFLNSIYLGDRYCENIIITDQRILFQINCISRLENGTKEWNYYSDADIEHGYLVFDGVIDYCFNTDLVLNDEIYEIKVIEENDKIFSFVIYGCNVSKDAVCKDIEILIKARKFYILNPKDNSIIIE